MRTTPWLALTLALTGCYTGFETEGGQLRLMPDALATDGLSGFEPTEHALLQGTTICVTVDCGEAATDCPQIPRACFAESTSGSLADAGPWCVTGSTPGPGTWHFDPVPCDANAEGYAPLADTSSITVVDAGGVTAELYQWVEALAPAFAIGHPDPFPTDWAVTDRTFRIAEGGWLELPIRLSHPDAQTVAWDDASAVVALVPDVGPPTPVERPWVGGVHLEPTVGSDANLVLGLPNGDFEAARVLGVPAEATSLELVVAYLEDESGTGPFAARAVARDDAGKLVHGLPVTWRVDGALLRATTGDGTPGPDYAVLNADCLPPEDRGGSHTATLEVSFGVLSDQLELTWDQEAGGPDSDWTPPEGCDPVLERPIREPEPSGCGCSTSPSPTAAWLALGLLALRRRSYS